MEQVKIVNSASTLLKISLSGDIDLGNAEAFYQTVMQAYAACKADVEFDCTALEFIDSTTLGTFVKIVKELKKDGKSMRLVGLQSKIKKLFVICALDSIIQID